MRSLQLLCEHDIELLDWAIIMTLWRADLMNLPCIIRVIIGGLLIPIMFGAQ